MKKFLSTLLALTMLLALAAPALAENPTVTYYVRGGTAQYEPYLYETLVGLQKIQEMAGVDIDWTVVCGNGDEIKAQYVAMMASGNYPDIIQWQHNNSLGYVGGVAQMYADGIIIELNDVIDQYMPNYKKLLEENPQVAKTLMDDEGRYLYFTPINPLVTDLEKASVTWWGLMMRKDWLENVGMEAPTTIDEWYEVLTAFKTQDPNGNGFPDEIPFDGWGLPYFLPAFGVMNTFCIKRDGTVAYGPMEPEYKAYVCNRYASGGKNACSSHYINQNLITQKVMTDIRSKAMWAQNSRETLRTQLLAREQDASAERTRTLQAELNAIGKRFPELDKLIQSAYEDKVLGRIPESMCVNLLNQYEAERREKQERYKELTGQLAASRETESSVDAWLDMMQDYAQLEELDRPTLVRLIQKIEISERYPVDDHEERDIHIYYNFVGYIET